jgi:hypothetical protein
MPSTSRLHKKLSWVPPTHQTGSDPLRELYFTRHKSVTVVAIGRGNRTSSSYGALRSSLSLSLSPRDSVQQFLSLVDLIILLRNCKQPDSPCSVGSNCSTSLCSGSRRRAGGNCQTSAELSLSAEQPSVVRKLSRKSHPKRGRGDNNRRHFVQPGVPVAEPLQ